MDLLERFTRGEPEAFEALFRQYQSEVYGWIVRMVRDRQAAEDLTVETFWRVWRAHARFDPRRSFGAWARRVASNVAIDYLKTRPREVELPAEIAAAPERGGLCEVIERAFRKLPPKLQAVARLALIEDRPYDEIGAALGIPEGTVKSRAFRAVRRLREELGKLGVEP